MCFVWISEQTAIISLYSFNLSVFIIDEESVYCAVRNGSLNQTDTVSYLLIFACCCGSDEDVTDIACDTFSSPRPLLFLPLFSPKRSDTPAFVTFLPLIREYIISGSQGGICDMQRMLCNDIRFIKNCSMWNSSTCFRKASLSCTMRYEQLYTNFRRVRKIAKGDR